MDRDPLPTPDAGGSAGRTEEVMAAIDEGSGVPRLVIADVSTDGSWLSVPTEATASLRDWR